MRYEDAVGNIENVADLREATPGILREDLPGKPDVVFSSARIALFVDGDFWHGYRFASWKGTLSEHWRNKISDTKIRDRKHAKNLKSLGWRVIRVWEHELETDIEKSVRKTLSLVRN